MLLKSKTKRRRTNAEVLADKEAALNEQQQRLDQERRLQQLEDQLM